MLRAQTRHTRIIVLKFDSVRSIWIGEKRNYLTQAEKLYQRMSEDEPNNLAQQVSMSRILLSRGFHRKILEERLLDKFVPLMMLSENYVLPKVFLRSLHISGTLILNFNVRLS